MMDVLSHVKKRRICCQKKEEGEYIVRSERRANIASKEIEGEYAVRSKRSNILSEVREGQV